MNMPIGLGSAYDLDALRCHFGGTSMATPRNETLAILVVDDEPAVLDELTTTLGRRGLPVLSAHSPEAALAILASRPDIGALVTDIRMPAMDGIAMAERALAGRAEADALEVLLVTGYASPAQAMAAGRIGAFGLLQKPMRGADLGRLAVEALARAASRRRADAPCPPPLPDRRPMQAARQSPTEAAAALLHSIVHRRDGQAEAAVRQMRAPLDALLADTEAAVAADAPPRRVISLLDDLADAEALEHGTAAPDRAPISAHALVGAVAGRLAALGARCARRIILQPDADPAFELDTARLVRAVALLGHRALEGRPGLAELSLDAGAGQARLDLVIRPDARVAPARGEPRPEQALPIAVARRLVAMLGGRLDAWTLPEGGLRARLLIRGA
jgi:CheY-like chemotaxis protein